MRRANGPREEVAAAVRTGTIELVFDALAAERAFECADHCFGRTGRKIFVAAFAIRAYFEHKAKWTSDN